MARNSELKLVFGRERFAWGTGGDRVIIGEAFKVNDSGGREKVTIKGKALEGDLNYGLTYRFFGRWTTHEKYGEQFWFSTFTLSRPYGRTGVVNYLKKMRGLGPKRAAMLWDCYGDKAIEFVREKPETVHDELRIPMKDLATAAAQLKQDEALEGVKVELAELFDGRGFPRTLIDRVIQRWGNRGPEMIRKNPYVLLPFNGVGFLTADQLYLDIGLDPAAIERQVYCIHHAAGGGSGDTWRSEATVVAALNAQISSAKAMPNDAIETAVERGLIANRIDADGECWVATKARAIQESTVAESVADLMEGLTTWPDMSDDDVLHGSQIAKASEALRRPVGCLIGTPGTGKSFTLGRIAKRVVEQYGLAKVGVGAPTGKAAVRATELLRTAGVNLTATTIHRMLGVGVPDEDGYNDSSWFFTHNQDDPLPFKFILIDEASMLDTFIASALLSACAPGTHVLFVGDTNQLPPVGHGAPLRDMINAGVPCGELSEIIRNEGQIVRTCLAMRQKKEMPISSRWDLDAGDNLYLINAGSPATQIATLEKLVRRIGDSGSFDPVWEVQVLCAVNTKSEVSRVKLNRMMQELLNPDGERDESGQNPFRVGDKIICLKNGWLPAVDPNNPLAVKDGKIYVANGEMARVLEVEPRRTVAVVLNPDREIVIPRGKVSDDEAETETGCSFALGYVCSTHKYQGSEVPIAVVMLDASGAAARVCDIAWLYTAISRAKKGCLLIGRRSTAMEYVRRSSLHNRKTFLAELLRENVATEVVKV